MPGLIVSQLVRLNGGTVIAVDGVAKRLKLAEERGAAHVIDFTKQSPAEEIRDLTENRGADEEYDLGETIRRAEGHLAHVHLADSNRLQPGAGHTAFVGAFGALRDIGFDGYMAMECGIRGDAREVLPEVVQHLRSRMG